MKTENDAFLTFDNTNVGLLFDDSNNEQHPIRYYNVVNGLGIAPDPNCSYYGYIYSGQTTITSYTRPEIKIEDGMYFSISGLFLLNELTSSKVIIIEVLNDKGIYPKNNYSAMFQVGGKIESKGRLKYIDGCTDSLLISPVKMGDPCLNHLHFPSNIQQTPHTHPSHRIGIVSNGNGECVTPFGNLALLKGMIFIIKSWNNIDYAVGLDGKMYEVGNHCFYTFENEMDVIAFHPDSDFGPQDENHPMINRTIVNGISANEINEIQTK